MKGKDTMAELIHHVKEALLKRQEVERLTGLGRSAIYARLNPKHPQHDPSFPKPVALGGRPDAPTCVRWVESEVQAWIAQQIERSRATSDPDAKQTTYAARVAKRQQRIQHSEA